MIIRTALYVAICLFAQASLADTAADSLIERCRAQSKSKFESGITSTMREGAIEYSGCLEAVILELAEHTYPPEQTRGAKKEIRQQLDALSKSIIGFYWKLENENKWCNPSCGTMWHVTPYAPYHENLEHMIHEMVLIEQSNTTGD